MWLINIFFLHFSEAAATEILDNAIAVGEASAVDTDKKDEDLNFDEQVNNFQKVSFLYHFIKKFDVFSHSSRDVNSPTGNDPHGIGG